MEVLIVVDMQNDFVSGALGTSEAKEIVDNVVSKIKKFNGTILFTQDTHQEDYLNSAEGKKLPVEHCIKNTWGWQIIDEIKEACKDISPIEKPTFASVDLGEKLVQINEETKIEKITLIGLCTDICVISNAMLVKAFLPEIPIEIDSNCCAGVSKESHLNALEAMKVCQISVI